MTSAQAKSADRLRTAIRAYHATCDLVAAGRAIVGPLSSDNSLLEEARLVVVASLDACTDDGMADLELDAICADEAQRAGPQRVASSRVNQPVRPPLAGGRQQPGADRP